MSLDVETLAGLSPLESLLSQGYSRTTIARLAYLRIPQLRQWQEEMSFPTDTGMVRVKAVDNLTKELWKLNLPFDPVALYEAHVVLLERDGKPYGAKLSHFFEISKWKTSDIIEYAEGIESILTAEDISETYPGTYKVVKHDDGGKAIIPVPGVQLITAAELSRDWLEYSLIK
jgi:hypothetical protein